MPNNKDQWPAVKPGAEGSLRGVIEDGADGVGVKDAIQPQADCVEVGVADAIANGVGQGAEPSLKLTQQSQGLPFLLAFGLPLVSPPLTLGR